MVADALALHGGDARERRTAMGTLMHYIGGKQKSGGHRIAASIKSFAARVDAVGVVEPFCGGLSVTYRLRGLSVEARDACKPLITLYQMMQRGWCPPAVVDRETWEKYRAAPDPEDPMTAFVGFGCSRSGAWFSGFADRCKRTGQNYVPAATAASESLRTKLVACGESVTFKAGDYTHAPVRGVWYCDIPYIGTLGYPAVGPFDHVAFWTFAADVSQTIPVLVSEQVAPEGWTIVDEWSVQQRLNACTGTPRVERLFVHERWAA